VNKITYVGICELLVQTLVAGEYHAFTHKNIDGYILFGFMTKRWGISKREKL